MAAARARPPLPNRSDALAGFLLQEGASHTALTCFAPCLFASLRNQLVGETAPLELSEVGVEPPFHNIALLDNQSLVVDASNEAVARLETERLANRRRNHEATLRTQAHTGLRD